MRTMRYHYPTETDDSSPDEGETGNHAVTHLLMQLQEQLHALNYPTDDSDDSTDGEELVFRLTVEESASEDDNDSRQSLSVDDVGAEVDVEVEGAYGGVASDNLLCHESMDDPEYSGASVGSRPDGYDERAPWKCTICGRPVTPQELATFGVVNPWNKQGVCTVCFHGQQERFNSIWG
ncbi:E8 [Psittacus erithacus papillomavirus 1]|uniref:E8 n=2 Tax=Psittacus erithacus timneh papillomavirus TaxID=197772 RepID=Q8JJD3_PEPVA|nr:E8 [Psittacus erithacus papillomavirus 1]AAM46852.1 E8 [Psittacus erithacus papillomavirus 1]AAM75200.1 putative E7 protein [Thetapapillomavirus 1]